MMITWSEEYRKTVPNLTIDVSAGGAGKGITDVLSGVVDIGMVSRRITTAERKQGAWYIGVAKDAVVPVINDRNPLKAALTRRGITRQEFNRIWLRGEITTWGALLPGADDHPIHVYTRSDACGAAETWAAYLGGIQEDLRGIGVFGDPGLAEAVRKDSLGLGYNNINFAYDEATKLPVTGICPLPIDMNGNGVIDPCEAIYAHRGAITAAIADGRYPSPPSRSLYLVTKGYPRRKIVISFLSWILSEGQRYAASAGYVPLTASELRYETAKLNKGEATVEEQ